MEALMQLTLWHWFALSCLLLIGELLGAGGYLLWVGISSAIVGCLVWLMPPLAWQTQLVLFALGALCTATGWHIYLKKRPISSDQPMLNKRGAHYVGKTFVLTAAIENGRGKIKIDDCNWELNGGDLSAGTAILVTGTDGMILFVEKI